MTFLWCWIDGFYLHIVSHFGVEINISQKKHETNDTGKEMKGQYLTTERCFCLVLSGVLTIFGNFDMMKKPKTREAKQWAC